MVIKVYVSRTPGNIWMSSQQDHIRRVLEGKGIVFEEIDIADPHYKNEKIFMQSSLKLSEEDLVALPPQIFKDKQYRGDYDQFFSALECERLYQYLDLDIPPDELEFVLKQTAL